MVLDTWLLMTLDVDVAAQCPVAAQGCQSTLDTFLINNLHVWHTVTQQTRCQCGQQMCRDVNKKPDPDTVINSSDELSSEGHQYQISRQQ